MRRLVALDLPAGPDFVRYMTECFNKNEAISPIDQRLEGRARERVLSALRPTDVIDRFGEHHVLNNGEMVEDKDLVVVATSGTTGEPKGVVLTEAAVRASAIATSSRLGVDPDSDHWLGCLPLNHVGGLSVALRSVLTGTAVTLLERFDIERIDQALDEGATLTSLVPTTLSRLGSSRQERFRKILLGGSTIIHEPGPNTVATYGMTETGSGVIYDGYPLDQVEIEIGEGGEIALRCPMLLRCYRDGTDPRDSRGFFHTGDIGTLDDVGRLQVFGRISELIISGGEHVWPVALEQLLIDMPGVEEIGIVGIDDKEWGQRVVGVVVPQSHRSPDIELLNEVCRREIGPWAMLKELHLVGALPRTSIGKLDRSALVSFVKDSA
ncbi:MAG TPA: AMP-binding protein [Acidimicrobiales bacterium]|nr:AMP-binding protein [Acidimicrobiales bacterium]